jgi:hypothetical protein
MSLVSQQKFDELVNNTTAYLQDVLRRIDILEGKVDTLLSAPKASTTRSRKEASNEQ